METLLIVLMGVFPLALMALAVFGIAGVIRSIQSAIQEREREERIESMMTDDQKRERERRVREYSAALEAHRQWIADRHSPPFMSHFVPGRHRSEYLAYLSSPAWKTRAADARRRAGRRCQLCNRTGELHVHHRTYERLGHELDEDLIVLCSRCHNRFHADE